jgi:DHA3 family macrolide efflux protein-like MFS transporter
MWQITLQTKSGALMALFILVGFLPTLLLSPFGGVFADRFPRKRIILIADGGIAFVTLILTIIFASGYTELWLFFAAAAFRAIGTAFQTPAIGAVLPQIVPAESLPRINGIYGTIQALIMLVSPILSGLLQASAPLAYLFLIDIVTAIFGMGILAFLVPIRTHQKALELEQPKVLDDLKAGIRYIREHRFLLQFFLFLAALLFLVTPASFLTPLQVVRNYGEEIWRLTGIEIAFSLGMILGGIVLSIWTGFKNRMTTMILSTCIMAGCTIALGLVTNFWAYLAFMGIFGISMPFYQTPSALILQEHVEESYLGRVFSVQTMLFTSIMPLAMLLFGPLAELVKIEHMLLVTGILMLIAGLGVFLNRPLMAAGKVSPILLNSNQAHDTPLIITNAEASSEGIE